ncbi:GGDEF domain-containing protein [Acinetobacter sp. 194]|nr:GGDEF domain-containing protein [Acinetobacter shaoyimingii]
MMNTLKNLLSSHVLFRRVVIILINVLMGWFDYLTGYEFAFSIFYLVPIAIAAWFDNFKVTSLAIFMASIIWLCIYMTSGHYYSNPYVVYWNIGVRIIFFYIVAYLLYKIRAAMNELTLMAMKDSLTALNNTRAFNLAYQEIQKNNLKKQQQIAISIIDLDGFKAVNDTLGHSKGDEVLIRFAELLKNAVQNSACVARIGGDEFAIILENIDFISAEEFEKKLRIKFLESGLNDEFGIDYSMGMSIFNELPESADKATHCADKLMYQSKLRGKSRTIIQSY